MRRDGCIQYDHLSPLAAIPLIIERVHDHTYGRKSLLECAVTEVDVNASGMWCTYLTSRSSTWCGAVHNVGLTERERSGLARHVGESRKTNASRVDIVIALAFPARRANNGKNKAVMSLARALSEPRRSDPSLTNTCGPRSAWAAAL